MNKVMRYKGAKKSNLLPKDPAQFYTTTNGFVFVDQSGNQLQFYGKNYLNEKFATLTDSGAFHFCGQKNSLAQIQAIQNPKAGDTYQVGDKEYAYNDITSQWVQLGFNVDLSEYAKTTQVPTKTSDLQNDSGYLTQHQDISGKVDKDGDKVLSTNDYTTAEKTKLANIAQNAQVNVIESVTINGSTPSVSNKNQTFEVKSCFPIPDSVNTYGTTLQFCDDMINPDKGNAKVGMMYMGTVHLKDVPLDMQRPNWSTSNKQCEILIKVIGNKILELTLTSTCYRQRYWVSMYNNGYMQYGDTTCPWFAQLLTAVSGGYDTNKANERILEKAYMGASQKYVDDKTDAIQGTIDAKLSTDGSSVMTGNLVLGKNSSAMDLSHYSRLYVVANLDNDQPSNGKLTFGFDCQIDNKTSNLTVDGSDILTKDLADTYYVNQTDFSSISTTYLKLDGTNALAGKLTISEKTTPATGPKDIPAHKMQIISNASGKGSFYFTRFDGEGTAVGSAVLDLTQPTDYVILRSYANANYGSKSTLDDHINNADIHTSATEKAKVTSIQSDVETIKKILVKMLSSNSSYSSSTWQNLKQNVDVKNTLEFAPFEDLLN